LRVSEVYVVLAGGGVASGSTIAVTAPGGAPQTVTLGADPALAGVLVAGPIAVSTPPASTADAVGTWSVELDAAQVLDAATLGELVVVVRYTEGG
jgi:hypothetical protein